MTTEDAERRIAELEEALRRAKQEASLYKETASEFLRDVFPDDPPTEEEVRHMLADTTGTPILDIIAEFDRGRA